MSARTAQKFVQAAQSVGDKYEPSSHLPATVLYALASPATEETVREELQRRVDAGEMVTPTDVAELKRKLAAEKAATKEAKDDIKVHRSAAQEAKDERDRFRTELDFERSKVLRQAEEIERLKQDGVIHSYPAPAAQAAPLPAPSLPDPDADFRAWLAEGRRWLDRGDAARKWETFWG